MNEDEKIKEIQDRAGRRSMFLLYFQIGLIIFLVLLLINAAQAENFWPSFSLNLLTEIIGAFLVYIFIKINLRKLMEEEREDHKELIKRKIELGLDPRSFIERALKLDEDLEAY